MCSCNDSWICEEKLEVLGRSSLRELWFGRLDLSLRSQRMHGFLDLLVGRVDRHLFGVRAQVEPFRVHEGDIGQPEEAEHRLQIWHLGVRWCAAILAASRQRHV